MATYIWIHLEYKDSKTKKYQYVGEFCGDKIYGVFGILAGARSSIEPIYPPRGLPEDVCRDIKFEYDTFEEDAHTPSYLYSHELRECLDAVDKIFRQCYKEEYSPEGLKNYEYIYKCMRVFDDAGEPARMVFWFDN